MGNNDLINSINGFMSRKDVIILAQTMEKSKDIKLSVGSIIKKMDKKTLCFDHPLQRESERWNGVMVGNLISDVLQGNPIPELIFAEQIVNGVPIIWNLDGKQRCTNLYAFFKGVKKRDKISRSIRRYMISYHTPILDESGEIATDDEGFPLYEKKEFDIRGKKFCQLPEELQERLLDYSFKIVQYINCSAEDIAYHILRYNEGRPANKEEKGIIRLGERYARLVKGIASLPFFMDNFSKTQRNSGVVNRVITESMMLSNYFDEYNGNYDKTCDFIRDNADVEHFEIYEENINRLEMCVSEDNLELFDKKNSFLFITLFSRFTNSGLDDFRFNDFLTAFKDELHQLEINNKSFDELMEDKSTKDKNIVITRIEHLSQLMCDFLKIEMENLLPKQGVTDDAFEDFAQDFVSDDVAYQSLMLVVDNCPYCNFETETMIKFSDWLKVKGNLQMLEDCKYYKSIVSDCGIDDEDENLPYYIYAVKYCDGNDINIDIDDWFAGFKNIAFKGFDSENNIPTSNSTIMLKQSEIIQNLNNYINKGEVDYEVV